MVMMESRIVMVLMKYLTLFDSLVLMGSKYKGKNDCSKD
jgi:hypothetical protein